MNLTEKHQAIVCKKLSGDMVATIGENRKLLVFSASEIPEMKRGQGVALQKFKNGNLSDIKIFSKEEGLSWQLGEKLRVEKDITGWFGKRASSGKIPPVGFPRNNKF
jgi:topoisomerase-4 subunit A